MKKMKYFLLIFCVVTVMSTLWTACSDASASKIDVVNDVPAFDTHDIEWRENFIAELKLLTPEARKTRIDQVLPRLNASLIMSIRNRGYSCEITSITYLFGSGKAKGVGSGDGNEYDGVFTNQLYAVIKGGDCFKDSLMAFVRCFNGTFDIEGDNQNFVGTYSPVFTVEHGKGYNHYVDYRTSIWIAKQFNIPIYKGKGWNERRIITPERALALEDSLPWIQITPRAFPGDRVDLGTMTYTPAH